MASCSRARPVVRKGDMSPQGFSGACTGGGLCSVTSARQKEPENMDDLWVSFCEYGEGAATPKEKDAYTVAAPVKNMLHCKLTCSRNGCDGIFEISHLLAASFK